MRFRSGDKTQPYRLKQYALMPGICGLFEMAISERLRDCLKEKGCPEGELSRQSGVTQPTIHRILSGESSSPRRDNHAERGNNR